MGHIDLDLLDRVLEGKAPMGELLRAVSEHLAEICPDCHASLEAMRSGGDPGEGEPGEGEIGEGG